MNETSKTNTQIVPLFNFGKLFQKQLAEAGVDVEVERQNLPGLGWMVTFTHKTDQGHFATITHCCQGETEFVEYVSGWVDKDRPVDLANARRYLEIALDVRQGQMEWKHDPMCSLGVIDPDDYELLDELDRYYVGSISNANWEIRQILSGVRDPLDTSQFYSVTYKRNPRSGACVWDHPKNGWATLERLED